MRHFPIFLDTAGRAIVLAGGGDTALAKLRLLLKTEARLTVFAADPAPEIEALAGEGKLRLVRRAFAAGDATGAVLAYAATDSAAEDARVAGLARAEGALVNLVDNLADSEFITPAIVDRDPVTVAIGTEGMAPVLARAIKRDLEERLPPDLGARARAGGAFRRRAEALPEGRARRDFWAEFHAASGSGSADGLGALLDRHLAAPAAQGSVALVGAGPGDPDLLTLKARRLLDQADVVIHDTLVPQAILELARREAKIIHAGKTGFGASVPQAEINRLMIAHAGAGALVVRLKAGDPAIFGRLDEELEALSAAGINWSIVPGITAASAAAASLGQSLTRRGRNSALRVLTGHDTEGFAEQDWRALATTGAVAAIYMGRKSARFLQGRLMMHGADPATPVTLVEQASRPDQAIHAATLATLSEAASTCTGPAVILYGLAPRWAASVALPQTPAQLEAAR